MTRRNIKVIFIVFSLILIIPLFIFIRNFFYQNISDEINDWASFSDYLSGTLGLIINLATLLVTVFIAFLINSFDDKRNLENQKFEKQKLLREFQEAEYREIRTNLQDLYPALMSEDPKELSLNVHKTIVKYRYFITSNYHLFPITNEEVFKKLQNTLNKFSNFLEQPQEYIDKNKIELLTEYVENLDSFNARMQEYLLKN